jgi:hypothetical protein
MASSSWVASLFAAAAPDSMEKFCRRRGNDHDEGLGHWETAQARSGQHGGLNRGHDTGVEAPEGADRGGAAQRRRELALASNYADNRAVTREIRAWGLLTSSGDSGALEQRRGRG